MTYKEVAAMIREVGVPYAYYQFTEATAKPCPFIVFYYPGRDDFIADDRNYTPVTRLIMELYTDDKDFALEAAAEAVWTSHGLVFYKSENYIDSEKMYQIVYETEITINGEQN